MIPREILDENERLRQRVEELEYELSTLKATADGEIATLMDKWGLTVGQARLLRALAYAPGMPLSRTTLLEAVNNEIESDRTIDSYVKRVRKKLGKDIPIDTLYGLGYRLMPQDAHRIQKMMREGPRPEAPRSIVYQDRVAA